jgi:hypothetical protein
MPFCMGEFYIRQREGGETRGPFNEEQMSSLADAGKITPETQVTDGSKSQWSVVGQNSALKALLFPEQKKLGLKKGAAAQQNIQILNKSDADAPGITVEQMLAAAEGRTVGTMHLKDAQKEIDRASRLSLPMLGLMMLLSGLANCLPRYAVLIALATKYDVGALIREPFAVIGLIDLLFAVVLFLNVAVIFPLVRLRAMLGLGYFLIYYWSIGDMGGEIASICAGLGLFICTITLSLWRMIVSALVGVGGMGYLAWTAWQAFSAAS